MSIIIICSYILFRFVNFVIINNSDNGNGIDHTNGHTDGDQQRKLLLFTVYFFLSVISCTKIFILFCVMLFNNYFLVDFLSNKKKFKILEINSKFNC